MKKVSLLFFLLSFCFGLMAQTPLLEFAHPYSNTISSDFEEIVFSIQWYNDTLVVSGTLKEGSNVGLQSDILLGNSSSENLGVSLFYNSNSELVDSVVLGTIINDFIIDADGTKYFLGEIRDSEDFDLTGLNPLVIDPMGFIYDFVVAYAPNDDLSWLRYGGINASAFCQSLNRTIVAGHYSGGNQVFGVSDTLTFSMINTPNNAFALSIDEEGSISDHLLIAEESSEVFSSCDNSNALQEIAICGVLVGQTDYQWGGNSFVTTDYEGSLPIALTYDYDLNLIDIVSLENQSGAYSGAISRVKYDQDGNLYFGSMVNSGNYILRINETEHPFTVNDSYEFVIIKLSPQKELLWLNKMAHTDQSGRLNSIKIDHNGFVNVCGLFDTTLEFLDEDITLTGQYESGFFARWTPEGELVWAHTINDGGINNIRDICITPNNEMYIGGTFSTYSTDFDLTEEGSFDIGIATGEDAFLAKYTISNPTPDVFVEQGWQTTEVTEAGATDAVYVRLSHAPSSPVQVIATPNNQLDLGNGQGVPVTLNFAADVTAVQQQVLTVTAFDDVTIENLHSGLITFTINSNDSEFDGLTENTINVVINDNDVIGIEELNETSFSISPNPASNELNISFATIQQNVSINIFDESGKLVLNQQVSGQQHRINISELAFGNYTVAIHVGNEKYTKTFIKH